MEKNAHQHRTAQESSGGSPDEPRGEAAPRAAAQMLANPRRTRRN